MLAYMSRKNGRTRPRTLAEISGSDAGLKRTLRMAEAYAGLNDRLQAELPESAKGRIRAACIEGDCLVLAASSPAWASRARVMAESLRVAADDLWPTPVRRFRVIVMPEQDLGLRT